MGSIGKAFGFGSNVVARLVLEIRRCAPVVLHQGGRYALVFSSELLEKHSLSVLAEFSSNMYLLLTANRTACTTGRRVLSRVLANNLTLEEIAAALVTYTSLPPGIQIMDSDNPLDGYAIDFMKLAKLLPSALVTDMEFSNDGEMEQWCAQNNILHLACDALSSYCQEYRLHRVCQSGLFLHSSLESEIFVYRSNLGEPEHYAIVIGNPSFTNPIIRLHSSCYTGDLLGSLSCDCRSQLLRAIQFLGSGHGGIVLYISQEGRGIGLANKIRAYNLQIQDSLDTIDANRFLGFDDDERIFLPAVSILNELGISEFQMLTSNPSKVSSMRSHGFTVTKMIPLSVETNKHNDGYIKTKRERLGHVN
ncbi:GTP cyclohydrolase II [Anaplasma capra]|uniref:GTP cyclohydrolase II n=1 Tax=Anaplasma capra TaxID=1562740 RepID=UPI0021D56B9F|nr:GTP cyclohydrolase II [Anaplasma capra]MCU7611204.1 GTP cyclohydrolase II RibA [Anaplasma capra]MCU7612292.1 GTP cyclohydrolase II RibA [Anaplasma capra]